MVQECAFRAHNTTTLLRSRSLTNVPRVGGLSRCSSVPGLNTLRVGSDRYGTSTMYKYRRDFEPLDAVESDRINYQPNFYWPTYRYQARRTAYVDPIPNSLEFGYPGFHQRYKWYHDWLNPTYWRKHRDPNYDRPLWNHWRPWQMDNVNIKHAIDMYRNGIIDFNTLDKKWIEPHAQNRRGKDWFDVYTPAARYGAHRYFYSYDVY